MFGFDLVAIIKAGGYLGITAIVFAESGLFFGFFLPGDSLIFTAGFLSSQGFLNVWVLAPILFIAAVAGGQVGYVFGRRIGPPLFMRPDSRFFKKEHLLRAQTFFNTYGARAVVLARFMPIVRTFTPIVAGAATMRYSTFVLYNCIGAALWTLGLSFLGYLLGASVPNADHYILPIVILIIFVSILPPAYHIFRSHKR